MNRSVPEISSKSIALSSLGLRQKGRISELDFPSDQRARLMEMGLTPGVDVRLIRFAPLGDPIEVEVRGYRLSLRKREAESIRVACL